MKPVHQLLRSTLVIALVFLLQAGLAACPLAPQDDVDPSQQGSLLKVPDSAGFYMASMNHQRLIDAIFESNAWDSIKKSAVAKGMKSAYRRGKSRGYADYNEDNPFAEYLEGYGESFDAPGVKIALGVVEQILGKELFVYVDNDAIDFARASREAQVKMMGVVENTGGDPDEEVTDQQLADIARVWLESFRDVQCPTAVVGAVLDDPDNFRDLLGFAQSSIEPLLDQAPEDFEFVRDSWQVVDENSQYMMLMNLDLGEMPWELADIEDPELVSLIEEFVVGKKVSIGLGIVDNLLIVGIGRDKESLINFSDGAKLIKLPKLNKLSQAVQKNEAIAGVFYTSQEYGELAFSLQDAYKLYAPAVTSFLRDAPMISDQDRKLLTQLFEKELPEFLADMQPFQVELGMTYGFASLTDEGVEVYSYADTAHKLLDGSKPLTLTDIASENTLGFFVQRPDKLALQYDVMSKWLGRFYALGKPRLVEFVTEMDSQAAPGEDGQNQNNLLPEIQDKFQGRSADFIKMLGAIETFATGVNQTTRDALIPAVDGQEAGFFIDLVVENEALHGALPESVKGLPIPMPALVVNCGDSALAVKAAQQYRSQLKDFVEQVTPLVPEDQFNDLMKLAVPTESSDSSGTSFRWQLPAELGLNKNLQPGALVAKDRMVFNLYPLQAQQFAGGGKANLGPANVFGPASIGEPAVSKFYYDHRVTMRGWRAWQTTVQKLLKESGVALKTTGYQAERDTLQFTEAEILDWFGRYVTMLECFHGISSRSYLDGDGTSAEILLKFQDVQK